MTIKQSSEMPGSDSHRVAKILDAVLVEIPSVQQIEGSLYHAGGARLHGKAGSELRATPEARSEPRLLRRGGAGKEADVLRPCRPDGTDRATVDPRRENAGKESAIKSAVPGEPRAIACRSIEPGMEIAPGPFRIFITANGQG
jgi:hypothetical protein